MTRRLCLALALLCLAAPARAQGTRADYERAASLPERVRGKVLNAAVRPEWLNPGAFWYRTNGAGGERRYWLVDARKPPNTPKYTNTPYPPPQKPPPAPP